MQALLAVIVTWLSINAGLPAAGELPEVAFASSEQMVAVRATRLEAAQPERASTDGGPSAHIGEQVHAIYDDTSHTIYLHRDWTGATPADVSVLVHEMVHHLQNVAGLEYDCPEAREKPAYQAQARWLELFGRTLAEEFEIDAMTILVRTNCMG